MARIKLTYVCPKCEEGITAETKPEICPGCGAKFPSMVDGGFVEPFTLAEQNLRINDERAFNRFVLNLPVETATNIMNDALNIIQSISGKKARKSDIRIMMGMAIQIGEIAKAYEQFFIAGGAHTPELFMKRGDTDDIQKNGNGEKSTTPKPTPLFLSMDKGE